MISEKRTVRKERERYVVRPELGVIDEEESYHDEAISNPESKAITEYNRSVSNEMNIFKVGVPTKRTLEAVQKSQITTIAHQKKYSQLPS